MQRFGEEYISLVPVEEGFVADVEIYAGGEAVIAVFAGFGEESIDGPFALEVAGGQTSLSHAGVLQYLRIADPVGKVLRVKVVGLQFVAFMHGEGLDDQLDISSHVNITSTFKGGKMDRM